MNRYDRIVSKKQDENALSEEAKQFIQLKCLYHLDSEQADVSKFSPVELPYLEEMRNKSEAERDQIYLEIVSNCFELYNSLHDDLSVVRELHRYFNLIEYVSNERIHDHLSAYRTSLKTGKKIDTNYVERVSQSSGSDVIKNTIQLSAFRLYLVRGTANDVKLESLSLDKKRMMEALVSHYGPISSQAMNEETLIKFILQQRSLLATYRKTIYGFQTMCNGRKIRETEDLQPFLELLLKELYEDFRSCFNLNEHYSVESLNNSKIEARIETRQVNILTKVSRNKSKVAQESTLATSRPLQLAPDLFQVALNEEDDEEEEREAPLKNDGVETLVRSSKGQTVTYKVVKVRAKVSGKTDIGIFVQGDQKKEYSVDSALSHLEVKIPDELYGHNAPDLKDQLVGQSIALHHQFPSNLLVKSLLTDGFIFYFLFSYRLPPTPSPPISDTVLHSRMCSMSLQTNPSLSATTDISPDKIRCKMTRSFHDEDLVLLSLLVLLLPNSYGLLREIFEESPVPSSSVQVSDPVVLAGGDEDECYSDDDRADIHGHALERIKSEKFQENFGNHSTKLFLVTETEEQFPPSHPRNDFDEEDCHGTTNHATNNIQRFQPSRTNRNDKKDNNSNNSNKQSSSSDKELVVYDFQELERARERERQAIRSAKALSEIRSLRSENRHTLYELSVSQLNKRNGGQGMIMSTFLSDI